MTKLKQGNAELRLSVASNSEAKEVISKNSERVGESSVLVMNQATFSSKSTSSLVALSKRCKTLSELSKVSTIPLCALANICEHIY